MSESKQHKCQGRLHSSSSVKPYLVDCQQMWQITAIGKHTVAQHQRWFAAGSFHRNVPRALPVSDTTYIVNSKLLSLTFSHFDNKYEWKVCVLWILQQTGSYPKGSAGVISVSPLVWEDIQL